MSEPMTKDEAVDIAHTAKFQTIEELLANYAKFHAIVEVTPKNHYLANEGNTAALDHNAVRGLHAAIGLSTEAAEMLDAYKKMMFGKRRPIRRDNIREELGDSFFYFFLMMSAYDFDFKEIVAHNVEKLANRYIERFDEK